MSFEDSYYYGFGLMDAGKMVRLGELWRQLPPQHRCTSKMRQVSSWNGTEVVAMANTKQACEFLETWHYSTTNINRHVDQHSHYEGLSDRLTDLRPQPYNSC
ncbi:unnamed protein product [Schistocephalus solidus]|uniref:SCP domain-containing protein n=1 Tax=Schistocephalus solidus TaxID=70667 RepID=A0A183SEX6_SCHSO|nr:unnamed protein product [Schistocephalus solidus]